MGCAASTPSGRRSHKRSKSATHDIFIERYPRPANPDHAHRNPNVVPAKKGRKPQLALVVRRKDATDAQHEAGELGRSRDPATGAWESYRRARNGVEMRGGRLYDTREPKKKKSGGARRRAGVAAGTPAPEDT